MQNEPSSYQDVAAELEGNEDILEKEYRRGYGDGFIEAANAIYGLWFLGKERSADFLFDFWNKPLMAWRLFRTDEYFPPKCIALCTYCGKKIATHLDHVYPRSRGGKRTASNLVPACSDCNIKKGARTPEEWLGGT